MGKEKRATQAKTGGREVSERWLIGLLMKVQAGDISVPQAVAELSVLPYEDLMHAKLDHHRSLRTGFPEVVFGPGKTLQQLVAIAERMAAHSQKVLITRVDAAAYKAVKAVLPDARYNEAARAIIVDRTVKKAGRPGIVVLTGGTADIPVAEEAAVTAELLGNKVLRIYDAGVAGIHRLVDKLPEIRSCRVIVVIAGMEGALASVVGGLVDKPVIAVPTSIGYGANFGGISALLAMLTSCSTGVTVVNIDNGFGAAFSASMINKME
jgi:NCAIR mutase (PurE)-related protein